MLRISFIVIVALTALSEGAGILPDGPLVASIKGRVMFTTTLAPTDTPFTSITWKFGDRDLIVSKPTSNTTTPEFQGRITLFISTGSLEIGNLRFDDTREYDVTILPGPLTGRTILSVFEPVSSVTLTLNSTKLVEFNDSLSLTCFPSSGSSLSFVWMNGSSEVTESDRVKIVYGGSALIIVGVTRYDQNRYRCKVFNPVSEATSDPVSFTVFYGPDNVKLTRSPSQEAYGEGTSLYLACLYDGHSTPQFTWFLNGSELHSGGSRLQLINIRRTQSGNYSCGAYSFYTMRYQASEPSLVSVLERVSNVVVKSNTTDLVEFNSSVSLSCSSFGFSPLSYVWMNGSSEITASDRVQITDGNSTLTIINVSRYDQGPYSCNVSNYFSSNISNSVKVSISYGPENTEVKISPSPECFVEGSDISLLCSTVSRPDTTFQWFLNGTQLNHTGPELKLIDVEMNQSGNYSCEAFNTKTLIYQTSKPSVICVHEGHPFPGWAIALIVITCVLVLAGTVYYCVKRK